MLLSQALEERWLGPAPFTLILAHAARLFAGINIVDTLPAELLTEDRAIFQQAVVKRADAMRTRALMLIMWEAQAIVILHAFAGALRRIVEIGIIISKASGAIAVHIHRRFAIDDPLCQQFAHAARAAVTVQRHTRQHPESAHTGHLPEQRLTIRGVCAGVTHQRDDACLIQKRKPTDRTFEQHLELVKISGEGFAAMFPRRAIDPARKRIRLVPADDQSTRLLAHVHQIIGVTQARRIRRELMPRHSP